MASSVIHVAPGLVSSICPMALNTIIIVVITTTITILLLLLLKKCNLAILPKKQDTEPFGKGHVKFVLYVIYSLSTPQNLSIVVRTWP